MVDTYELDILSAERGDIIQFRRSEYYTHFAIYIGNGYLHLNDS